MIKRNKIIFYKTPLTNINVDIIYKDETFWLSQKQLATLFGVDRTVVTKHIKNILSDEELDNSTCANIAHVQKEGNREVQREIIYYNLDMIIAVGYRINSKEATQFRIWATNTLKEFIIKGFAMDDDRLKNGQYFGKDYFKELLERVRSIRTSERRIYQSIDHFFDKKDYPYLAVSLYNLVPSCSTCNQRKSSKKENIFYPYTESFNDSAKFKYKGIKSITKNEKIDFLDSKRVIFDIEAINNKEKVEKHIEVFNLKNLYDEHKDIIAELLQKREIYNDSYLDELMQKYEGTLFKNREDLLRLVTCGYVNDNDINKRPLSKLIKDISEELKLL
ncbi:MAG: virulence RhuM family protein [Sulfurimonas sp.]|uniref:virulence RhuM family protein n=1 Tax=Sulfurimonas sp. TaxID=2022749 RepID=UPI00261A4F53|nr:RhuM family protein [Sulfurimonas sp.]MCW8894592.1 virulence RhuM family protein [Sulfurimonas sp.]MCW8953797.1 virulence RhuM family protein [Sulfurimonas sp.]MCW9068033.1 virulence RhuM family protein [Sulfurimonas sp.]